MFNQLRLRTIKYFLLKLFYRPIRIPGFCGYKDLIFLFTLVSRTEAKKCLEIGTFFGRSAYVICAALQKKEGRQGKLICVDIFNHVISDPWHDENIRKIDGYPYILKPYLKLSAKILTIADGFNLTMQQYPFMKRFVEVKTCNSSTLDLGMEMFDFTFIDGDHSYDGVKRDFNKVFPHVKRGGIISVHDNSSTFPGIQKFVCELRYMPELAFLGQRRMTVAFQRIA